MSKSKSLQRLVTSANWVPMAELASPSNNTPQAIFSLAIMQKAARMVLVFTRVTQVLFMKAIGSMVSLMDLVINFTLQVEFIMVYTVLGRKMELAN